VLGHRVIEMRSRGAPDAVALARSDGWEKAVGRSSVMGPP